MAGRIKVTPELLRSNASEMRTLRANHDDIINQLSAKVSGLSPEFEGAAATAYINKFDSMRSTFTSFSEMLEEFATKLDAVANTMEAADQQAAAQAQ